MTRRITISSLVGGLFTFCIAGCVLTPRGTVIEDISLDIPELMNKPTDQTPIESESMLPKDQNATLAMQNKLPTATRGASGEEQEVLPPVISTPIVSVKSESTDSSTAKTEPPVLVAIRHYLEKKPQESLEVVKRLSPENQKLFQGLLPLVIRSTQKNVKDLSSSEVTAHLEQIRQLASIFENRAQLTITKKCFCWNIERFGVYEPIVGEAAFEMGVEGRSGELVQVYLELKNFLNLKLDSMYETAFMIGFEIRSSSGQVVWKQVRRVGPEQSRSRRNDIFLNCYFRVPAHLAVGTHTLNLTIQDVTGMETDQNPALVAKIEPHRSASCHLDFEVKPAIPFGRKVR